MRKQSKVRIRSGGGERNFWDLVNDTDRELEKLMWARKKVLELKNRNAIISRGTGPNIIISFFS